MKNAIKIMAALKQAFQGHRVENLSINDNYDMESIFVDGKCVGLFYKDFLQKDFDNPEIEIKVKATLKDFTNFIDYTYNNETISDVVESGVSEGIIRHAIEKGVREWAEGSQANN